MRKLVLTGYAGESFAQMAEYTVPLFLRYATRHGAAFECRHLVGPRPPSWMKVPALLQALAAHDVVLWVDVDVVIADSSASVFDLLGDGLQALVEHGTECGAVPNCGVWVVSSQMRAVLKAMWEYGGDVDHPWWEQASLMRLMGYAVEGVNGRLDKPTQFRKQTTWLGPEWNHHPHDARRVELDAARFVHVTQYADRLATIGEFAGRAV